MTKRAVMKPVDTLHSGYRMGVIDGLLIAAGRIESKGRQGWRSRIADELRSMAKSKRTEWFSVNEQSPKSADEIERLRVIERAAVKTLEKYKHLADGDNCTLIDLKRALAGYGQSPMLKDDK